MRKIYVIALRETFKDRRNFLNKEDAIRYWKEKGKDLYTYWEELIY